VDSNSAFGSGNAAAAGGEVACSGFIRISGLLGLGLPFPSSPPPPSPSPPVCRSSSSPECAPRSRRLPLRRKLPADEIVYLIFEILPFYFYPRDFIHFAD